MQRAERNVAAADLLRFVIYFDDSSTNSLAKIVIEMFNEAQQINREISEMKKFSGDRTYPSHQLLYLILAGERRRNLIYNC